MLIILSIQFFRKYWFAKVKMKRDYFILYIIVNSATLRCTIYGGSL